jgi:hypothetical protein
LAKQYTALAKRTRTSAALFWASMPIGISGAIPLGMGLGNSNTGMIITGASLVGIGFGVMIGCGIVNTKSLYKQKTLIEQYNNQFTQRKDKPTADEELRNKGIDSKDLQLTGHSLGGRLAAEAAIKNKLMAYTFNSADVSLDTRRNLDTFALTTIMILLHGQKY